MAISSEDVARVRAATDIVALIGEHGALKRQGTRWVGLCPFHQEKTPSFSVNAELGVYYCFGCQRSGDAITFVRELEHLDFAEAVRMLADRAGITVTEDASTSADRQRRAPLLSAMSEGVTFYHERLLSAPDAGPARDYLRSRGYDGETVRHFQLGWAPDDWDALARRLHVPDRVLVDSGLGFVNRLGRQQDAFRARIIFPIFDPSGRPIALGGRVLPQHPADAQPSQGPKYKNSQEGPIYSKRRTLYGLNWAKKDVVATGEVVVCEGYTDVIGFHLAGVPRAVATCGTALGEDHFRLLRNFARRVVLAYDADAAGQAGASRVYEWERHHEVDVAVASLPPGADPGNLAATDPEELREAVAEAKPFLAFRVERVLQSSDLRSPEARAKTAEAAMAMVAEHPNELVRDQYLMVVSDRTGLEPSSLRSLLERGMSPETGATRRRAPMRSETRARPDEDPGSVRVEPGSPGRPARGQRVETQRAGLEALRMAIHDPEPVMYRLEPILFADDTQRVAFEVLRSSSSVQEAIETADERGPEVALLLRRLAVEEPKADADNVVVQLVRLAARRALARIDARARTSPESFAELASVIGGVMKTVEDLDEPELATGAAESLLAWLLETGEETA
jgi:DNA primase